MSEEEQARAALFEQRYRKITIAHRIGDHTSIQAEALVDELATAEEIFTALSPLDDAFARFEAKAELSRQYLAILNKCGEIEMSARKYAAERYSYEAKNRVHNANKRLEVGLNVQQQQNLKQIRDAIRDGFERIDEMRRAATEYQRVLGGESPFAVLEGQIDTRLYALRGERQDAA